MDRLWRTGLHVLAVLLIMSGAAGAIEFNTFLQTMARDLARSTQVIACQYCTDEQLRLTALDAAAAGMPFVDGDRDHLVYVVDPVREDIRTFRYKQKTDRKGASAHVIPADGSGGDREAIREALEYYHAITEFNEVELSDLPRSDTLKFESAFALAAHEYARVKLEQRIREYIKEFMPFETRGSRIKIAAFGTLTGLLNDKLSLPSENNEVRVKFSDGSSWAFELESFNLEITTGSTSVGVAFKDDGGKDPAGNSLYPNRGAMFGRNFDGTRALITKYVELAQVYDLEVDTTSMSSGSTMYRLRCETRREPNCVVQAL